ncbi:hypothetical protein [Paludisphaera mucosa]|uniref:Uncharacterized protein n=1 Tax=Paludisphaera mucosa TaxID=3030827 RepID=A0ABT6FEE7_9BACT|nr:hypothetical protein [Paludisphaera mucosa]MDG3005947.1 hypothetical protein [Paludisphaera mucosa]
MASSRLMRAGFFFRGRSSAVIGQDVGRALILNLVRSQLAEPPGLLEKPRVVAIRRLLKTGLATGRQKDQGERDQENRRGSGLGAAIPVGSIRDLRIEVSCIFDDWRSR